MTNYGTIPTSSSSSSPPVNAEFISRAKERIIAGLATRRPWKQMFDYHMFSLPRPLREAAARVKTNLWYFTMNYALVVLLILFVSLLWHPISLLVFLALMLIWSFLYFLRDEPLVVVGRTIGDRTVLAVLAVFSVLLLLLTHATTEILVSLLVGLVLVAVHAAVRRTDDLFAEEEGGGA